MSENIKEGSQREGNQKKSKRKEEEKRRKKRRRKEKKKKRKCTCVEEEEFVTQISQHVESTKYKELVCNNSGPMHFEVEHAVEQRPRPTHSL